MAFAKTILTAIVACAQILSLSADNLAGSNFDASINDPTKDLWLVAYYDPECIHSKKLIPEFDFVANKLEGSSGMGMGMGFGKIDCTREKEELCSDIMYYPTLKWFRDGEFHIYEGPRDRDSLLTFASHMTSQPVTILDSSDRVFENEIMGNDVAFLLYPKTSACKSIFEKVARKFQYDAMFAELQQSELNDEWVEGLDKETSIATDVLIQTQRGTIDDDVTIFEGDCEFDSLVKFVENSLRSEIPDQPEPVDPEAEKTNEFVKQLPKMVKDNLKFFEDHPWLGMSLIVMGLFDVIYIWSLSLPPERMLARFLEKHVGKRIERIFGPGKSEDEPKEKNE